MKSRTNIIIAVAALVGLVGLAMNRSPSTAEASGIQITGRADFEAPLAPCGAWVEVSGYGRCFQPAGIAVGWRPYCYGRWVRTDCGWYWESDEPWAWACYHYGTWVDDPLVGWVWVPGVEWAPAWVEWRFGGGFIGWAPCAPHGVIVAPAFFAFVEVGRFHDPIRPAFLAPNPVAIVARTTPFAAFRTETRVIDGRSQRIAVNDGPGRAAIEKATGHPESVTPLAEAMRATPVPNAMKPVERATEPVRGDRSLPGNPPTPGREPGREGGVASPERHAPPVIPPPAKPSGPPIRERDGGGHEEHDGGHDGGHGRGGGF